MTSITPATTRLFAQAGRQGGAENLVAQPCTINYHGLHKDARMGIMTSEQDSDYTAARLIAAWQALT